MLNDTTSAASEGASAEAAPNKFVLSPRDLLFTTSSSHGNSRRLCRHQASQTASGSHPVPVSFSGSSGTTEENINKTTAISPGPCLAPSASSVSSSSSSARPRHRRTRSGPAWMSMSPRAAAAPPAAPPPPAAAPSKAEQNIWSRRWDPSSSLVVSRGYRARPMTRDSASQAEQSLVIGPPAVVPLCIAYQRQIDHDLLMEAETARASAAASAAGTIVRASSVGAKEGGGAIRAAAAAVPQRDEAEPRGATAAASGSGRGRVRLLSDAFLLPSVALRLMPLLLNVYLFCFVLRRGLLPGTTPSSPLLMAAPLIFGPGLPTRSRDPGLCLPGLEASGRAAATIATLLRSALAGRLSPTRPLWCKASGPIPSASAAPRCALTS